MNFKEKIWYFVLSIAYGLILGLISAIPAGLLVESIPGQRFTMAMAGVLVVAPITLIIMLLQLIRIQTSLKRTEDIFSSESEKEVNFWNWETNLQFYGMVWIFLAVIGMVPFLFSWS